MLEKAVAANNFGFVELIEKNVPVMAVLQDLIEKNVPVMTVLQNLI